MTINISKLVVLGDSLSDRGTMDKRELLGFIPMSYLSGLHGTSPRGRFTNGFLWGDYIAAAICEGFSIQRLREKHRYKYGQHSAAENADLADGFITNDHTIRLRNEDAFCLEEDGHVLYEGQRFARFYCEGGLTAHDYSDEIILDPGKQVSREILSTLEEKRNKLVDDDKRYHVSLKEKQETLVIEWSGANDLITVNKKPTLEEAIKAVKARIANLEAMIAQGYTHFVLFNMPDLSLTPRFKALSEEKQVNASHCCAVFNALLESHCKTLKKNHPTISLDIFDVCTLMNTVYDNPEKYDFEQDKLTKPYIKSKQFKENQKNRQNKKNHTSPSDGYMFWDDVHPTQDMHNKSAVELLDCNFMKKYQFKMPVSNMESKTQEAKEVLNRLNLDRPQCQIPNGMNNLLKKIQSEANKMAHSCNKTRLKKGKILNQLVIDIMAQQQDLEKIRDVLIKFKSHDSGNMKIIKKHVNPFYDFFARKKTTHSEQNILALSHKLEKAIQDSTLPCTALTKI